MKARYLLFMLFIVASALKMRANDANWDYNPYAFQYDMSVYVALSTIDDKSITDASDYQIAAFCGEECRGIAEEKIIGEHKYCYLRIRSNQTDGETINFKVKDASTGKTAKVIETIVFQSQHTIGYPSAPFNINARNPYTVTFVIDGVEHRSDLFYGDVIDIPTETNKEGHTFVGWSPEVDATVLDHNVTYTAAYTINKYKLTYKVDDNVYKESEVEYNSAIIPESAPEKEGNTFSGWNNIPEIMPANDVEVTGTFTVNQYKVTFISDGVTIKEELLDFSTEITAPENPSKVGHTFAGWNPKVEPTMPSHDVIYTAMFSVNTYKLTYIVDGEVYKQYELDYGTVINPEETPIKEGFKFSGWSEIPHTMPGHDVNVSGTFETTTSIYNIKSDTKRNRIFNITANALKQPQKGINIINGKKVLIK